MSDRYRHHPVVVFLAAIGFVAMILAEIYMICALWEAVTR